MNDATARAIEADARAHLQAGAFSLLLEGVAEGLARKVTEFSPMPTIGIGASLACDGQVLVTEDMLGLGGDHVPRFVKQYADVGTLISQACEEFAAQVRDGTFPEPKHCYGVN